MTDHRNEDIMNREHEDNLIRLGLGTGIALMFGILWAIILGVSVTVGGAISALLGAGIMRAWSVRG